MCRLKESWNRMMAKLVREKKNNSTRRTEIEKTRKSASKCYFVQLLFVRLIGKISVTNAGGWACVALGRFCFVWLVAANGDWFLVVVPIAQFPLPA